VLKLHASVGLGDDQPTAAELESGLHWLDRVARETDIAVQRPVPTNAGGWVSVVEGPGGSAIPCTLQHWVDGAPPSSALDDDALRKLGVLMAKLHRHGQQSPAGQPMAAMRKDSTALESDVARLRRSLDPDLLPPASVDLLISAQRKIEACLAEAGSTLDVWGPIHGDLHAGNLVIQGGELRPIDFTGLLLGHYLYDLGAAILHVDFRGKAAGRRRALLEGYQQILAPKPETEPMLDAFVAYAAISNIAWNSTIPEQASSKLFADNLSVLIDRHCTGLVHDLA
jgi:Ser/Thr protein kinase RdoA (MazF antagonist)